MADSLYKVATSSVGPDSKPIYDVFEGTRKLDLPEFQQRGLNIDQLAVGQAPTGFQSQFTPTVIPNLTAPKLEQALGSTPSDTNALFQAKLAEQSTKNADLLNQALAKVKLSPQEVEAQNKLLGLQQIQESAIQGAQERPLSGTILKAGLASEIQNIASGNTRESLVNMRMQTQEAQTLNLLTNQRQQELDALKMQLDQGNLDTQNLFKAQQLSEDIKNAYFDKVQTLSTNAKNSLSTIIEKFNGLTIDQLSPESAAQIGALAQQAGIPMEIITQGMKVAKDQIDLQNAQEDYKNQTARINATTKGSTTTPSSKATDLQANLTDKVTLIDTILNSPGLDSRVGPNALSRKALSIGDRLGAGQQFAGAVHQLVSKDTLDTLLNLKAQGGTLGALSDQERIMLQSAATKIADWEIRDANNVGIGEWNIDEGSFKAELQTLKDLANRALTKSLGYDPSLVSPEDVSAVNDVLGDTAGGSFDPSKFFQP